MKKSLLLTAAAIAAMGLAGCSSDEALITDTTATPTEIQQAPAQKMKQVTIRVANKSEKNVQKTTLGDFAADAVEVVFKPGDQITAVNAITSGDDIEYQYIKFTTCKGSNSNGVAEFIGTVPEDFAPAMFFYGNADMYAAHQYPIFQLPYNQTAVAGSFDPQCHLMFAVSDMPELDGEAPEGGDVVNLNFVTVNNLVKFTAPCNLSKVVLRGNLDEPLAGTCTIGNGLIPTSILREQLGDNFSSDIPISEEYFITLSGNIEEGNEYYIAIPDTYMAEGFTLELHMADGFFAQYTNPNQIIAASDKFGGAVYKIGDQNLFDLNYNSIEITTTVAGLAHNDLLYGLTSTPNSLVINLEEPGWDVTGDNGLCTYLSQTLQAIGENTGSTDFPITIVLPEGITTIPVGFFEYFSYPLSIKCPASLTVFSDYSFKRNGQFHFYMKAPFPSNANIVFDNCKRPVFHMPSQYYEGYRDFFKSFFKLYVYGKGLIPYVAPAS